MLFVLCQIIPGQARLPVKHPAHGYMGSPAGRMGLDLPPSQHRGGGQSLSLPARNFKGQEIFRYLWPIKMLDTGRNFWKITRFSLKIKE